MAVANASWTWGNVGTLSTGVAGAFPATNPADKLIDRRREVCDCFVGLYQRPRRAGAERLAVRHGEMYRLDPKTRLDPIELQREHALEMLCIARCLGGAKADALFYPIHSQADEDSST